METGKRTVIDEYIGKFPSNVREKLEQMRQTIRKVAPDAEEDIRYGIPTFRLNGNLVHFAAFKNHIGFYPTPAGIEAFHQELSEYEMTKGAIRFPLDKPIPYGLVSRIVKYRVAESLKGK